MPFAAPHPCSHPSCSVLVPAGEGRYCDQHKRAERKAVDARRDKAVRSLYTYRWSQASKAFLVKHPLCECSDCKAAGRIVASEVVDHIKPHCGDFNLFWDRSNWQAMSKPCHDRKTATEDGGFGRQG